ncbi:hypothetical protein SAMN04487783_2100 [Agrococcus baldri]|uniref:Uncharacterized protein n=1 Tax=Agrococcus baldri TaxID=153730 RepID=A0AA94HNU4_9MICO|nr:hypothetical protein [Agrococcus baldri]SFS15675.1 hypothetical protein SAMN04487783_2100 [Agrococcus baldri]
MTDSLMPSDDPNEWDEVIAQITEKHAKKRADAIDKLDRQHTTSQAFATFANNEGETE